MKKLVVALLSCLTLQLQGAETEWTASSGTVPDDGDVYYVNNNITVDDNLTINGILEIRLGKIDTTPGNIIFINGTVYVYNILECGQSEGTPLSGTINVNYPGAIILLGGTLKNAHANSAITINAGGAIYNYHGIVDPGSGTLEIKAGGKFHNVRGNFNHHSTLTLNNGCEYLDSNEINLNPNLAINYIWTITEHAVINGYGEEITLGPNGAIEIAQDASLHLEDVTVNGIGDILILPVPNIRGLADNSKLSVNNVVWNTKYPFIWGRGSIDVLGDWTLQLADAQFTYTSNQISTIASNATMHIKNGTFGYSAPTSNLIQMADKTSTINLDRGTLRAYQPWAPTNGTLLTTGPVTLQGDTTLNLQGIAPIQAQGGVTRIGDVVI